MESCGDKLLKDSGSFFKWMGGSTKSPNFNMQRWSFLRAIVEHMATTMSIADWNQKRPTIFDHDKEVGAARTPRSSGSIRTSSCLPSLA